MYISSIQASLLLGIFQAALAIPFPPPTGPYRTTFQNLQLTDKKRIDPSSPNHQPRSLMISIFSPIHPSACSPSLVPYLDPITASFQDQKFAAYGIPSGLFGSLELQTCTLSKRQPKKISPKTFPLVIFSPALATTRLFYSVLAQQLSSEGYIVITIDHPYDVDIVTYPDNSTILGIDIPDESLPAALTTRVQDISFIINELAHTSTAKALFPTLTCGVDTSKVGIIGHSFGGAAAAEALLSDSRLISGINLDGTFFGKVFEKGLSKPFMIFAHEGKNRTTDYSWEAIWPKLTGWKRELEVCGAQHYAFSDLPAVVKVLGIAEQAKGLLGSIDGGRMGVVVGSYVEAFFGRFLKRNQGGKLLDKESSKFPEVTFASKWASIGASLLHCWKNCRWHDGETRIY